MSDSEGAVNAGSTTAITLESSGGSGATGEQPCPPSTNEASTQSVDTDTTVVNRMALPPEYEFKIRGEVFGEDFPSWCESRDFTEGALHMKTTVSLLTNISKRNGEHETSVIILIAVPNAEPDCWYSVSVTVTLYDPSAGKKLREEKEGREFMGKKGRVKFIVSLGLLKDSEYSRGKTLKLQVKVSATRKDQPTRYWSSYCSIQ